MIHASTFSKILAPGLRLAWLVLPSGLSDPVERIKQAADLHTSTLTQLITHEVVQGDFIDRQLERVRSYYRVQRDAMMAALESSFPAAAQWTRPDGGMFVWVTLPHEQNAADVLREAVARGVAFVPGGPFFANGGGDNTLRLSYSVASEAQIAGGMAQLGALLHERLSVAA